MSRGEVRLGRTVGSDRFAAGEPFDGGQDPPVGLVDHHLVQGGQSLAIMTLVNLCPHVFECLIDTLLIKEAAKRLPRVFTRADFRKTELVSLTGFGSGLVVGGVLGDLTSPSRASTACTLSQFKILSSFKGSFL